MGISCVIALTCTPKGSSMGVHREDKEMSKFDEMADRLGKKKTSENKEIRMNIRVEEALRDAFVASCRGQDTTAARELRDHMRRYVAKHGQGGLF